MKTPEPPRPGFSDGDSTLARLRISLMGGIEVTVGGRDLGLRFRKARALLAYMALNDTGIESRERLAGLLWSDVDEASARGSLRQVLAGLRGAFREAGFDGLDATRDTVALDHGATDLDLDRIMAEIAAGSVPQVLVAQPRAIDTLMAGYEDVSPMFDDWIAGWRRTFQERVLRTLEEIYEDGARPPKLRRRMAEAAFVLDPVHEGACRTVMRIAAEAGETGAALRAYATLYDVMGDEMDMEPSAPTRELVASIKMGQLDPAATTAGDPASAPLPVASAPPRSMAGAGAPTVAILPFRVLGPETVPDYFADGLIEDTVCTLATLREPVVMSSNSTRKLRGTDYAPPEIGEKLGVSYLVSGTVRRSKDQLRLSVELSEASSSTVLWARAYQTTESQLFTAQDEIAASIAHTLVPRMRDAELRRSRGQRPEDMSAYQLLLQARELAFTLDRPAFERAGDLLVRATGLDPGYAPTHTSLADWYSIRLGQGWSPDPGSDLRELEAMARVAIGIDSGNGRALAMLGHNRTILMRRYDEAVTLLDRALEAAPNDAETLLWSSPTFAYLGDPEEAVRRAERAIALSPHDPYLFRYEHFLCVAHYAAGDYEAAAHWGMSSHDRNPHYTSNLRMTAAALVGLDRLDEARGLADIVMAIQPGFRVSSFIDRQPFRDDVRRGAYGRQLIRAGLPK